MTQELPRFLYLYATCCDQWLALFGMPSTAELKFLELAPTRGWVRQADGTWRCDEHPAGTTTSSPETTGITATELGDAL
ncbi:hypothetical protein ABT097_28295 [Streptomyces sp. NPDC002225]|uniref:hypothetical protein n=1 Tax=Streptomyces sp. NPDC002225 TaxID=3154413 RepID=UPI0033268AB2